jgi:uncharacterized membrane protein
MYSTQRQIEYEKQRRQEKESEQRTRLIQGMIIAPIFLLGWFPIVWILSKIFR